MHESMPKAQFDALCSSYAQKLPVQHVAEPDEVSALFLLKNESVIVFISQAAEAYVFAMVSVRSTYCP